MKVAKRAGRYQKSDRHGVFERGIFLSEHRRCVPEIIAYCNELAYQGRLQPLRESLKHYPLPHMGYAHIPRASEKVGSSRVNRAEAEAIALWLKDNRDFLTSLYPHLSFNDCVAIITPIKRQAEVLQHELDRQGLTVKAGTVHSFQGGERPIILFSSVYGAGENTKYFFDEEYGRTLNVAVSRAKDSFLVFGNMNILIPKRQLLQDYWPVIFLRIAIMNSPMSIFRRDQACRLVKLTHT